MEKLTVPERLRPGDKVATVSLSWGGAGDAPLLYRYYQGKRYLEHAYGLEVIEMPHTLAGSEFVEAHPEARAADLMEAFADPEIKGIFTCIGGSDSIRLLPFVDLAVIHRNPKVFIGYSDTTITHLMCCKAGLQSYYGPSILAEFAENFGLYAFSDRYVRKALFEEGPIGRLEVSPFWTSEYLEWSEENKWRRKQFHANSGYDFLQGAESVTGRLFGGCLDVLVMAEGTELWTQPSGDYILFLETSEDEPPPDTFRAWLTSASALGLLAGARGILFGKPYNDRWHAEYRSIISRLMAELGASGTPVVLNASFGHCDPMVTLPYGALAEIDPVAGTASVLD